MLEGEIIMKKVAALAISAALAVSIFSGCGAKPEEKPQEPAKQEEANKEVDTVTTASIVNNQDEFLKAAGKDGTWIICTLADMTIDKEIVLEGEFENKGEPARKIALYTQDADHKVTARFNLTAPKLTVKSENARIQGGTFKGDVYVEAKGFSVVDATVEGNIYFADEEAKSTFKLDKGGTVTGTQEIKQ